MMPAESQELKDAGLKITLPRVKILQILESSEVHHVSAEDVYKLLLKMAKRSVWRLFIGYLRSLNRRDWSFGTILKAAIRSLSCPQINIMTILFV